MVDIAVRQFQRTKINDCPLEFSKENRDIGNIRLHGLLKAFKNNSSDTNTVDTAFMASGDVWMVDISSIMDAWWRIALDMKFGSSISRELRSDLSI